MSKLARRLAHANTVDVHLDGAAYRLRKINSALLVGSGWATLLIPQSEAESVDQAQREAAIRARAEALSPEKGAEMLRQRLAVVCAAITHGWVEGEDVEPLQVVLEEADADVEAGIAWIEHLPPHHVQALFAEAMKLALGGAAAKAIASFRPAAEDAGRAGPAGP